ncbi:MAG: pitrilysin family protein [Saprospiraceae bacterium]
MDLINPLFQNPPMLNRKSPPPVYEISNLRLPRPQLRHLDNGIPVYVLDAPGQEVVKIEAVYQAGRPQEIKRLASRATLRLLREGTTGRSGAEIAEHFDFYGGSLSTPASLDVSSIALFSLKKYVAELLPVFAEVLQAPSFPELELETFRRTNLQELQVELEKVEVLAYRAITELIFGENHPYGYNSVAADYPVLNRADLQQHFEAWHTPVNCRLFASGRIDEEVMDLLNRHLGQHKRVGQVPEYSSVIMDPTPRKVKIAHPDSLQTAIRVGRRLFNRQHPDYNGMLVLNTILGGYFGSRLMTNIREKKGYTYNIYSSLDAMLYDGCFYVATEVNRGKATATLRQIMAELQKLRDIPVDEMELGMVRNYLLGLLLNGLDGPLNASEMLRILAVEGLSWDGFEDMVEVIRTITPAQLQGLAQRYWQPEDLWTVTVG